MEEVWKDIPGYEGHYKVSNLGRIESLKSGSQILKTSAPSHKYKRVSLSKNGKKRQHSIHRLVLLSFVGESDKQVNHIDGDKKNNSLSNLEYCTSKENINHAWDIGLRKTAVKKNGKHIINDYESGMTLVGLTKKYKADIRDLKVYLKENNIEIRAQRSYMIKIPDSKFINLFNENKTTAEIAKELKTDISTVINRRKNLENRGVIEVMPFYQRKPRIKEELKREVISYSKNNKGIKNKELSQLFNISVQTIGRIVGRKNKYSKRMKN